MGDIWSRKRCVGFFVGFGVGVTVGFFVWNPIMFVVYFSEWKPVGRNVELFVDMDVGEGVGDTLGKNFEI